MKNKVADVTEAKKSVNFKIGKIFLILHVG